MFYFHISFAATQNCTLSMLALIVHFQEILINYTSDDIIGAFNYKSQFYTFKDMVSYLESTFALVRYVTKNTKTCDFTCILLGLSFLRRNRE